MNDVFKAVNMLDITRASCGYDKMGINELRARLYQKGVDYPDDATREMLIILLEGCNRKSEIKVK